MTYYAFELIACLSKETRERVLIEASQSLNWYIRREVAE